MGGAKEGGGDVRGAELLDAQAGEPLSHVDAGLEGLALDEASDEATSEGVAGAVGVDDAGGIDGVDGVLGDLFLALDGDDGGLGAVGDDGDAGPLGIGLGQVGDGAGDAPDVRRVGQRLEPVRPRVRLRLRLIADHVVPVRRRRIQRVLEELRDEGRRHVDHEGLVVGRGLLGQGLDGVGADCGEGGLRQR